MCAVCVRWGKWEKGGGTCLSLQPLERVLRFAAAGCSKPSNCARCLHPHCPVRGCPHPGARALTDRCGCCDVDRQAGTPTAHKLDEFLAAAEADLRQADGLHGEMLADVERCLRYMGEEGTTTQVGRRALWRLHS